MEITRSILQKFVKTLPSKIRGDREFIVGDCIGEKWDKCVRKHFWETLTKLFCQSFEISEDEARKYVYVEGFNRIPSDRRGNAFFGSKMYPDAAIISPEFSAAIELDHGKTGSKIRNSLAKASFSVILGEYDCAIVLFFVDLPKSTTDFHIGEMEKRIIEIYQTHFNTTLYLV
ncbi:hypothetical protein DRO97_10395 [Archaeoglobales archaeon]|nr:MAG: hypothetical protein DRO97_10395 [Archaeoglobales archaeon]